MGKWGFFHSEKFGLFSFIDRGALSIILISHCWAIRLLILCTIILNESHVVATQLHQQQAEVHATWHRGHYTCDSCCWLHHIILKETFIQFALFSKSELARAQTNEDKIVTLLPDQPLLASLRKTGLQTQKAPLASPAISKQMHFSSGIQTIQKETTTPNRPAPEWEMNIVQQKVALLLYMSTRDSTFKISECHEKKSKCNI